MFLERYEWYSMGLKMKKTALKKDFVIEIKKSLNRYISILLIVALGVAFFSGIRATETDMQISGDTYFDRTRFMDIRVVSTMGLTNKDLTAIEEIEGVKAVEPVKTIDVLSNTNDSESIFKLYSRTDDINKIKVTQGRLPEADNECLIDSLCTLNGEYSIGDTITFRSGNELKLEENLGHSNYTIVGIGDSPLYLSYKRGNSSIGNGSIDYFAVLTREEFKSEVYSEIYVTVENAAPFISYSKEYEERIEKVLKSIEGIAHTQSQIRYEDVLREPRKELENAKTDLANGMKEAEEEFTSGEKELNSAKEKITKAREAINEGWEKLLTGKKELDKNKELYHQYKEQLAAGKKEIAKAQTNINNWETILTSKRKEYMKGLKALEEGKIEWEKNNKDYEYGLKEINDKESQLNENLAKVQEEKTKLEPVKDLYPAEWEQLTQTETYLLGRQKEVATQTTKLEEVGKQLASAKGELDKSNVSLTQANKTLQAEEAKLILAKSELKSKEIELLQNQKQLVIMNDELINVEIEIQKNENTLKTKKSELTNGEKDIAEGEETLKREKEKANKKISEAKEKISTGEKELAEVEVPKWYVLDRNSIQTYVEYGQDAERIGNIGKVFPVIFFLVAALVSLTTMTRMVEEQRTQIGTLKALGYGKISIASKYIIYALSASLLGSILGVLIGEQVLPKVIIIAYKILYYTLPEAITPYNYYYGVLSAVTAIACTTLAAFFSCYKELLATPAKLMRPEAPTLGKRVILEYLPFIWRRLNFTSKAAVRNLLRYKKRFFMTVIGIGSCTALLLVGFGIKDSIGAIADIQYTDLWKQDATLTIDSKMNKSEKDSLLKEIESHTEITSTALIHVNTMDAGFKKAVKSINLIVPEQITDISDYVVFRDRKSKEIYELQKDGAIITEKLASLLKVEAGDVMFLDDGNQNKVEVKITAVTENYMMHYVFISSALYEKLFGKEPDYKTVYLKCNVAEEKEESFAASMLKNTKISNISFTSAFQKQISDMLNSLNLVVYVLIVSAGLLAFIVMYNLNNININERKRELATLKVLGFMDMEVGTYIYRENIMLTTIGTVFGMVLGIVLHYYVIITAELDMLMFGRNIKSISYIYSILLTFAFAAFVNFVMYFKLQKIDMVESLKSVE